MRYLLTLLLLCSVVMAKDITFRNYAIFDKADPEKNQEEAWKYLNKINSKYPKKKKNSGKIFLRWDEAPYQIMLDQFDEEGTVTNTIATGCYVVRIKPEAKDKVDVADWDNVHPEFLTQKLIDAYGGAVIGWRLHR